MYARGQFVPNRYTFQWKIENINHCWLQKGERLDSPPLTADALEETKWTLRVYPMGHRDADEDEDSIGFFLHREVDFCGPDDIEVSFRFAFMGKDGSFLKERDISKRSFPRNRSWGLGTCEKRENVFVTENNRFPLVDTLTVKCTIWESKDQHIITETLYARTIFKENRGFFRWRIGNFSDLDFNVTKKFKDSLIDFDLTLEEDKGFEKTLIISINSIDEGIKYFSVRSSIANFDGAKEKCGYNEFSNDDLKIGDLHALPFHKWLRKNKSRYDLIDVLFLDCEYVVPIKTAFYESADFGLCSSELLQETSNRRNEDFYEKEKSSADVLNDMKFLYDDAIFSDMELRTSTKTFPIHKAILSARSPVFRYMFSMKENSGHIDITDFEEDTVQRMLVYMYTDSLEDLQLESALKLFKIADKYQIKSLKGRCSSFLKRNSSSSSAREIPFLPDYHYDSRLKCFVYYGKPEFGEEVYD